VQRTLETRGLAQRLVELELQDERQEIARVRGIAGDVVLRTRVEILFRALHRRRHALVLAPQLPPGLVVVGRLHAAVEHGPAPFVDQLAERQERDLVQRHLHLLVDHRLLRGLHRVDQADAV